MIRPETYIHHVLDCIRAVEEYVGDDIPAFLGNRMAQDAVLRQLQIMAESSQRLPVRVTYVRDGKFFSSNGNLASYISSLELLEVMTSQKHRAFVESYLYLERLQAWRPSKSELR